MPGETPQAVPLPGETPSAAQDFANADLSFASAPVGIGSPDVAFSAPNIIGDFFGSGSSTTVIGSSSDPMHSFGHSGSTLVIPSPSASVVGRQKIAENTSPIPRDRVFLNYSYFDDVPLEEGGVNVNRLTPGFEKTFFNKMASFQMQFPMALTLNSDVALLSNTDTDQFEFGNINMALKGIVYQDSDWLFSSGLAMTVPTADDLSYRLPNGTELIRARNDSVHLLPFLGAVTADPNGFFLQGFLQLDFDVNGNAIHVDDGAGLNGIGDLNDPTFLFADIAAGYWLTRNYSGRGVTGIAPIVELHYNRSLESTEALTSAGGTTVGSIDNNIELLNLVLGTTIELNNTSTMTFGYATPLMGSDRQFDGEIRVLFNYYFGGPGGAFRQFVPNL
jgi:hypothetical protein